MLIAVQVAIGLHALHWWRSGTTISPIEPSESMEFTKHGIVNAGLVFFALAIGSTLVFGRWFCGWGCHLVALQDFARWLLGLVRIRPKPIRSVILGTVPLLAFMYMFIMPLLDAPALRLAGMAGPAEASKWTYTGMRLTTQSFWATFPGAVGAVLTLLACGFAIIYILGAKGFCATGCPYGAIFGAADRFAPLRIRVNEDCTQSGHCTAVCTSNVRVHDEVREYGMVVDPGCMKCLDCVSVCPNEALSVGWGSIAWRPRHESPVKVRRAARPVRRDGFAASLTMWLLLALFCTATTAVFVGFDLPARYVLEQVHWILVGLSTAITLAVMALLGSKRAAARECTFGEELLLALFFLAGMVTYRGLWNHLVPFLFALALSAISAWLLTQACLLISRRQLSAVGLRLKHAGRLQPGAIGFAAIILGVVALMSMGALETSRNVRVGLLQHEYAALIPRISGDTIDAKAMSDAVALKQRLIDLAPDDLDHSFDLSRLMALQGRLMARQGRLDDARKIYDGLLGRPGLIKGDAARIHFEYAMLESLRGDGQAVIDHLARAAADAPEWVNPRATLGQVLQSTGDFAAAAVQFESAVRLAPNEPDLHMYLAACYAQLGRIADARRCAEAAAKLAPGRADIQEALRQLPKQSPK